MSEAARRRMGRGRVGVQLIKGVKQQSIGSEPRTRHNNNTASQVNHTTLPATYYISTHTHATTYTHT